MQNSIHIQYAVFVYYLLLLGRNPVCFLKVLVKYDIFVNPLECAASVTVIPSAIISAARRQR